MNRENPRSRRLPPLAVLLVSLALAAAALPSSLNLPQSNPSTVLEYAPVPPEEDDPPPPDTGNLSSLALGSSGTVAVGGDLPPPPPPRDLGVGSRPSNKRCVDGRQTEDRMAPPCVPFFDGDNFGATWNGVSRDEITVLIYLDEGCPNYECSPPAGTMIDLDAPPKPACPKTWPVTNPDRAHCDYIWIRVSRAMVRYFNDRFQTYGRRVHYHAYITAANNAALRRSDAAEHVQRVKPFATIDYATYSGFNDAYVDALAARHVLVFTSRTALPASFFRRNAPMAYGLWPDVEHWSDLYASYVCQNVAPHPVAHAGHPQGTGSWIGEQRRFGLWYTRDPGEPGLRLFAALVKDKLKRCGVSWETEATFEHSGFTVDNDDAGTDQAEAVARFQAAGVTTVLYLGGSEGKFTHAADAARFYPEIVVAGDLDLDNNEASRLQNANVWKNAWAMHLQLRHDRPEDSPGFRAMREANPDATIEEASFANEMYRDHFMLFQAIQVAGPELTPQSVDKGFHAIPPTQSMSPYVASCYFDPGDYTCVKDAAEMWWDPAGDSPDATQPGCWRMTRGGARFWAGRWPGEDVVFADPSDPCTAFEGRYQINP